MVNDACGILKKPLVSASVLGFEGQLSVFHFQKGPCYRCLYPEPPPAGSTLSCSENGVLGVLPGTMGVLQATECIKIIADIGVPLSGRLLHHDALSMSFTEFQIKKSPTCPSCLGKISESDLHSIDSFCGVAIESAPEGEITVKELKQKLGTENILLIDVREPYEAEICTIAPSTLIPLSEFLSSDLRQLNQALDLVIFCKSGRRSKLAVDHAKRLGFKNVKNLQGGILEWIKLIDPKMRQY